MIEPLESIEKMSDDGSQRPPRRFGLVVVGDEVLNGPRWDGHLEGFRRMLHVRGHELGWHWVLPDDPTILVDHLRFSMARRDPVFVCGGIGATPDDHTRACAARAAGVPLERHPRAKALIEGRFGAESHPNRILMADLPAGCELIPNPINQIPGFTVDAHHFLPGFPEMARPMAEAVLDQYFAASCTRVCEESAIVLGTPESRLVPMLSDLTSHFPELKVFSLPHLGQDAHILVGVRGRRGVAEGFRALCAALSREGIAYAVQDGEDCASKSAGRSPAERAP